MLAYRTCCSALLRHTCAGEIAVGFFTTQFVPAGTELTFNYNFARYSAKTISCSCGAKSCTGFIGGDASAKQLELRSDSEEEMDDESTSPKKNKKVVQRYLLGRAITKKKEEKEWAPGMAEGWSSDDEDLSGGEEEVNDDPARGKKRKAAASGSRKRFKSSSGASSRESERQRWIKEHPNHTPFDLELWGMCDRALCLQRCRLLLFVIKPHTTESSLSSYALVLSSGGRRV